MHNNRMHSDSKKRRSIGSRAGAGTAARLRPLVRRRALWALRLVAGAAQLATRWAPHSQEVA